jgi:hypothetical protein
MARSTMDESSLEDFALGEWVPFSSSHVREDLYSKTDGWYARAKFPANCDRAIALLGLRNECTMQRHAIHFLM